MHDQAILMTACIIKHPAAGVLTTRVCKYIAYSYLHPSVKDGTSIEHTCMGSVNI